MDSSTRPPVKHLGKKIGRIREILGMKQETLAEKMGISQQTISKLEQSETIEENTLDRIANALGMDSDAIKNFSEEAVFNIIANTITNNDQGSVVSFYPTFNPIDKWVEAIEDNKRLYEILLNTEREKVALLEKMVAVLEKK